jgi:His/Glu/Gln/Arg/opine family amino acid ABC transporter permease subunit
VTFDWSVIWQNRWAFAGGVLVTVELTVCTMLLSIPLGILLMALRRSPSAVLRAIGLIYVETFRNIPLILLVFWLFYVLPTLLDVQMPPFTTGLLGLTLIVSAYNAETFRAGVNSIRRGQSDAALALGMSRGEVMRIVILPQAVRRVLPILASTWVSLFKDTSLVSVIAVAELSYVGMAIRSSSFRILEVLTAMAAIYWCLGYPQAKLVDWIHRRFGVVE